MSFRTVLIVPAWSDQAGQCRIVAREGRWPNALADYRTNSEMWAEEGLMNSRGKLVCAHHPRTRQELENCQPLMAGLVVMYDITDEPVSDAPAP